MNLFAVGQRWSSTSESELGLGVVKEADNRRVTIYFPSIDEQRTYAIAQAPLNRIQFDKGDTIETRDGEKGTVLGVENNRGYLIYLIESEEGQQLVVPEVELADQIVLNSAKDRLLSGHTSKSQWFHLRSLACHGVSQHQQSAVAGLCGARVQLTEHQYYIAHEVGSRYAPRVLLADEVGLGKTIEAGLIIHQQLYTGRAQRVLIVVPDALAHQWLVEMLRKFNLKFSLLDAERCAESESANPFLYEQLILVPKSLMNHRTWAKDALGCDWDLLVVDEAHHYHWDEDQLSHDYQVLAALCEQATGVLLLTATPEQLGIESHFARLKLLDPHRYNSLDAFKAEEREYQSLMAAIEPVLSGSTQLTSTQIAVLESYLGNQSDQLKSYLQAPSEEALQRLLGILCDRHGTGRILFRNTRQRIKGFPQRQLLPKALAAAPDYDLDQLYPERVVADSAESSWLKTDTRVQWLKELLTSLAPKKVLIICHHAATAMELSDHLKLREGLSVAAFHENLTLIERDRCAAYFASQEEGAQALICSEIGSEGRNFQFASHLVLFDLPETPDLLEQRIGRLDRIGQTEDIKIHVPYFMHSASETLFRWYQEVLNAFEAPSTTASTLHQRHQAAITQFVAGDGKAKDMEQLFKSTAVETQQLAAALAEGRDLLLELNSCNEVKAQDLIHQVKQSDDRNDVQSFVELAFDCFGFDVEELGEDLHVVRIGSGTLTTIPGIDEEGMSFTFSRAQALHRDDVQFITWEHPLVAHLMDVLFTGHDGSASVALINHPDFHNGAVYLEALYRPRAQAPREYQIQRFLPDCAIRVLVDDAGESIAASLSSDAIDAHNQPIDGVTARDVVANQRQNVEFMFQHAQRFADKAFRSLISNAQKSMLSELSDELKRLSMLKEQNPMIRPEELDYLQTQARTVHQSLQDASLHLDAIRLIINFHG